MLECPFVDPQILEVGDLVRWKTEWYLCVKHYRSTATQLFSLETGRFEIIDLLGSDLPAEIVKLSDDQ